MCAGGVEQQRCSAYCGIGTSVVEDQRSSANTSVEAAGRIQKERTPTKRCISSARGERAKRIAAFRCSEIGIARRRRRRRRRCGCGCRGRRIYQIIADDVEVDALGRCRRNIGRLFGASECVLHIRMRLWAGLTQPVAEVSVRILIERNDVGAAAIDREITGTARSEVSNS